MAIVDANLKVVAQLHVDAITDTNTNTEILTTVSAINGLGLDVTSLEAVINKKIVDLTFEDGDVEALKLNVMRKSLGTLPIDATLGPDGGVDSFAIVNSANTLVVYPNGKVWLRTGNTIDDNIEGLYPEARISVSGITYHSTVGSAGPIATLAAATDTSQVYTRAHSASLIQTINLNNGSRGTGFSISGVIGNLAGFCVAPNGDFYCVSGSTTSSTTHYIYRVSVTGAATLITSFPTNEAVYGLGYREDENALYTKGTALGGIYRVLLDDSSSSLVATLPSGASYGLARGMGAWLVSDFTDDTIRVYDDSWTLLDTQTVESCMGVCAWGCFIWAGSHSTGVILKFSVSGRIGSASQVRDPSTNEVMYMRIK